MAVTPHDGPRRLLVRGVNWLGDAVMTTPALLRLRARLPETEIALLTHVKLAELWRDHPVFNQVITFGSDERLWSISRRLRESRFDTALILPKSHRTALEVWLAGIPNRVGFSRPGRGLFLTRMIDPAPARVVMRKRTIREIRRLVSGAGQAPAQLAQTGTASHQIHDYLHLVSALGADPAPVPPRLEISRQEIDGAAKKFGLENAAADVRVPILGLNPGAEYGSAKRWPAERFIAAALAIQQKRSCVWLILGGPGDVELAGRIAMEIDKATKGAEHGDSANRVVNVAGKTTLRELMSLLKLCRVLLTNDTGPMHVAAALGVPVVVPFGSTSPELTGPGLPGDARHACLRISVPCAPCFRRACPVDFRCMEGISVAAVANAIAERLSG